MLFYIGIVYCDDIQITTAGLTAAQRFHSCLRPLSGLHILHPYHANSMDIYRSGTSSCGSEPDSSPPPSSLMDLCLVILASGESLAFQRITSGTAGHHLGLEDSRRCVGRAVSCLHSRPCRDLQRASWTSRVLKEDARKSSRRFGRSRMLGV